MAEIIVQFNKTTNSYYTSYAKIDYSVSYVDDYSTLTSTATITANFYIKPDSYTYTQSTSDSLYLGIRKGSSSATLEKIVVSPTLTNGSEVKSNVYNHIGSATFTVSYNSTSPYYIYLAAGYENTKTSRFAPFYMPQTDGSSYNSYTYTSGGSNLVTLSQRISNTACTAPTSFTASSTNFYSQVTLAWSGASSGVANTISSYSIEYRTSSDNSTWSSWASLATIYSSATSGSYTTTPAISAGYYIQYQIKTCGTAGSSFYSGWTASSSVRKSSSPTTVSYVTLSVSKYSQGENVTISWPASSDIDNDISYYKIEYSKNNSSWNALTTTTALYYTFAPTLIEDEEFVKFRICTVDSKGNVSGYKESSVLYREDYSGVKLCQSGTYSKISVMVCNSGVYGKAQVYVCKSGTYVKAVD